MMLMTMSEASTGPVAVLRSRGRPRPPFSSFPSHPHLLFIFHMTCGVILSLLFKHKRLQSEADSLPSPAPLCPRGHRSPASAYAVRTPRTRCSLSVILISSWPARPSTTHPSRCPGPVFSAPPSGLVRRQVRPTFDTLSGPPLPEQRLKLLT